MNYLSLFSGAGGGDLAFQHLLGFKCVGYVEYENYCQRLIKQRIEDGLLDAAPIFGDIRRFNSDGYAESYKGLVDVVSGGFPCQPFSSASHGEKVAIDMWPEMRRTVGLVRPGYVFAENVQREPIETASVDLEVMGYTSVAMPLSAKDMGADHIRERFWILAHTNNDGKLPLRINAKMAELPELCSCVWETYSKESRMDDGVAYRMDRIKAIGNGQIPVVAATAFRILSGLK